MLSKRAILPFVLILLIGISVSSLELAGAEGIEEVPDRLKDMQVRLDLRTLMFSDYYSIILSQGREPDISVLEDLEPVYEVDVLFSILDICLTDISGYSEVYPDILARAEHIAFDLPTQYQKAITSMDLASYYGTFGFEKKVLEVIYRIETLATPHNSNVLNRTEELIENLGNIATLDIIRSLEEITMRIELPAIRYRALSGLSVNYAKQGKYEDADRLLRLIVYGDIRDITIKSICYILTGRGEYVNSLRWAGKIDDEIILEEVLVNVIEKYHHREVSQGFFQNIFNKIRRWLFGLPEPVDSMDSFTDIVTDFDFRDIEKRERILVNMASRLADFGRDNAATELLEKHSEELKDDFIKTEVANILYRTGEKKKARDIIQRLELAYKDKTHDMHYNFRVYIALADYFHNTGDKEKAVSYIERTQQYLDTLDETEGLYNTLDIISDNNWLTDY